MTYEGIERLRVDRHSDGVVLVTIDRPDVLNAVDERLHRELSEIWRRLDEDPQARVAVVTGAGDAFCAGGDLALLEEMTTSYEAVLTQLHDAGAIVRSMIDCEKPIVSAINGVAVGAGLAVALLADVSVIGESVRLSDGHTRVGVAAGDHAVVLWPLLCGMAKAKYHLLTAGFVDGTEAERIGLVSLCVADTDVLPTALDIAERLAAGSQPAIRFTKHALNHWLRAAMPAFEHSLALEMLGFLGEDAKEGVAAVRARRRPSFPSAGAPAAHDGTAGGSANQ
jgi:enoyl-CoA hydratase